MAEQIGLQAVLDLGEFNKGLKQYNKGIGKMEGQTSKAAQSSGSALSGMSTAISGVAATAGAAAAATGVVFVAAIGAAGVAAFNFASQVKDAENQIAASLGISGQEAEEFGDIAVEVFKNNFAGSVGEAAEALVLVRQQLGDLPADQLQAATENAFRLADVFGTDVNESIRAAATLTNEFGLTQDQAFDLITTGFQRGLNSSDDFLDSIGEYSNLFAEGGGNADQFFSLLETGIAGGVLGTDKVADAFKEFSIRFIEGGDDAQQALGDIGLHWDDLIEDVEDGKLTTAGAFDLITDKIGGISDPVLQAQVGVALLGTQFEDLGPSIVGGIELGNTSLLDMQGAVGALDVKYNSLGDAASGIWRRILVAIAPIGDALLELANQALPLIEEAFIAIEPVIAAIAEQINAFVGGIGEGDAFGALGDSLAVVIPIFERAKEVIALFATTFQTQVLPQVMSAFANITEVLNKLGLDWGIIWDVIVQATQIVAIGIGLAILGIVSVFTGLITGIAAVIEVFSGTFSKLVDITQSVFQNMEDIITGVLQIVIGLFTGDLAFAAEGVGNLFSGAIGLIENSVELIGTIIFDAFNGIIAFFSGFVEGTVEIFQGLFDILVGNSIIPDLVDGILGLFDLIPDGVISALSGMADAVSGIFSSLFGGGGGGGDEFEVDFSQLTDDLEDVLPEAVEVFRLAFSLAYTEVIELVTQHIALSLDLIERIMPRLKLVTSQTARDMASELSVVATVLDSIVIAADALAVSFGVNIPGAFQATVAAIQSVEVALTSLVSISASITADLIADVNSIEAEFDALESAIEAVASSINSQFRSAIQGAITDVNALEQALRDALAIAIQLAQALPGGTPGAIPNSIPNLAGRSSPPVFSQPAGATSTTNQTVNVSINGANINNGMDLQQLGAFVRNEVTRAFS